VDERDRLAGLLAAAGLALLLGLGSAAARPGSGFEGKTLWDWLELLIVPLALGLGGSVFAVYFTRHVERSQRRTDLTLRLADDYLQRFDDLQRSESLLAGVPRPLSAEDRLLIRKSGNWLELAATLINREQVDTSLQRDLGIEQVICQFYRLAEANPDAARDVAYWTEMRAFCAAVKESNRHG
jgi:hypothetical protein